MLSIKIFKVFILVGFIGVSCFQEHSNTKIYQSYITDSIPKHQLIIDKNKIIVKIFGKGLFPTTNAKFITKNKIDTIHILERIVDINKNGGIVLPDNITSNFINRFEDTKIYKKSNEKFIFLSDNRPYFKKELIDSLIGNNTIYYINKKLYKVSDENSINIDTILKRPKRAKIKILNGKDAYTKYGIIGLNGVIEISDRKIRCK